MALVISPKIQSKLSTKHHVSSEEVQECFANREGNFLEDTRENHKSDPPTQWFIAETDRGRKLKVIFIHRDGNIYLRSAFEPDEVALRIYAKYGQ